MAGLPLLTGVPLIVAATSASAPLLDHRTQRIAASAAICLRPSNSIANANERYTQFMVRKQGCADEPMGDLAASKCCYCTGRA